MSNDSQSGGGSRILVKLRPSTALSGAEARGVLRPLFESRPPFQLSTSAEWFIAEPADGAATPWDVAHSRVADRLGLAPADVLYVEPDIVHDMYGEHGHDPNELPPDGRIALGSDCGPVDQDGDCGKAVGPSTFAWHLGSEYSQLAEARARVSFTDPRTRIAHLDTGYSRSHKTVPRNVRADLERSFVPDESAEQGAQDPARRVRLLDATGHGTGTIGILAGAPALENDQPLGGAPDAEVLPLRIAQRVVLLYTSAFAQALDYALEHHCDVLSMSMGGLPSRLWRETVDRAYVGGLCLVTAAGNNFSGLPARGVVYPARYRRVIAVTGVMADGRPYRDLGGSGCVTVFEGNHGPASAMTAAIAGFTPNIPWPRYGCPDTVRLNGEGTSAATPQVAAAAALWLEQHKLELERDWRRVEAVRHALFSSARPAQDKEPYFGAGVLQASAALDVAPLMGLPQTRSDNDFFPLLRILTGLGVADSPAQQQMFDLELMQRWMMSGELQRLVPDPAADTELAPDVRRQVLEAVIEDQRASLALRRHVADHYPVVAGRGRTAPRTPASEAVIPADLPAFDATPEPSAPARRRIRVYALDPSFSVRLASSRINEATIDVPWEELTAGPTGAYLSVQDVDATGKRYEGVDLDDRRLLARDGWAPSEGNPHFHQQMVYAVAMKTIEHFERALGRPVLWRDRQVRRGRRSRSEFTEHLTIRPHALRQANAFYSPEDVALLFGYFEATGDLPREQVQGSRVFTCVSYDIVAHETTHAVLDGMYRRFNEPTNPDVLAFHEGFADVVALMQRFTMHDVLVHEIARTRGDIEAESILGSLAVQFGRGSGRGGALRQAIGRRQDGEWRRNAPDPDALREQLTPHARGAVFVSAVFDAFVAIYRERTADLVRLATGGSGVITDGAIHPDLVQRLADEAKKSASHVLNMCIRALDYLPPVDVTFFEFLRALITADSDVVPHDSHGYRVAFAEAFRAHGIHPTGASAARLLGTFSIDALRWRGIDHEVLPDAIEQSFAGVFDCLKQYADACFYFGDRKKLRDATVTGRSELHGLLKRAFEAAPSFATTIGLDPQKNFWVEELRRAIRTTPEGRYVPQIIVALTQQATVRASGAKPKFVQRGGTTLIVDLAAQRVTYSIAKRLGSETRLARTREYLERLAADPAGALLLGEDQQREPFAALHSLASMARP